MATSKSIKQRVRNDMRNNRKIQSASSLKHWSSLPNVEFMATCGCCASVTVWIWCRMTQLMLSKNTYRTKEVNRRRHRQRVTLCRVNKKNDWQTKRIFSSWRRKEWCSRLSETHCGERWRMMAVNSPTYTNAHQWRIAVWPNKRWIWTKSSDWFD